MNGPAARPPPGLESSTPEPAVPVTTTPTEEP